MSIYVRHVFRFGEILKAICKSVIFYSTLKSNGNVIVIVTEVLLKKCNCNCNDFIEVTETETDYFLKSNVYIPVVHVVYQQLFYSNCINLLDNPC